MPRENAAITAKLWEVRYFVSNSVPQGATTPLPQPLVEKRAMVGAETAKEAYEKVENTYGGTNTFKYIRSVAEHVNEILY